MYALTFTKGGNSRRPLISEKTQFEFESEFEVEERGYFGIIKKVTKRKRSQVFEARLKRG